MDLSGRPLTDNPLDRLLYVDREKELRTILSSVQRRSNALVVGPPGRGKTSLLRRVESDLRTRGYRATFVDAAPASSLDDLIDLIRWRLGGAPASPVDVAMRQVIGQPPLGEAARLTSVLDSLGDIVRPEDRAVLVVDEPSSDIGKTLFGRLRDEVWQLPFVWIVGIDHYDRASLTSPPADAFFPVVVELEPLSYEDSVALLRARLDGQASSDIERIAEIAEGSPRRLLSLARDLVINERPTNEIVDNEQNRRAVLDELGGSASLLFSFLQEHGASSASDEDLLKEMGWTRARATQVLNSLEDAGLVVGHREKGGRRKLYELADTSE